MTIRRLEQKYTKIAQGGIDPTSQKFLVQIVFSVYQANFYLQVKERKLPQIRNFREAWGDEDKRSIGEVVDALIEAAKDFYGIGKKGN